MAVDFPVVNRGVWGAGGIRTHQRDGVAYPVIRGVEPCIGSFIVHAAVSNAMIGTSWWPAFGLGWGDVKRQRRSGAGISGLIRPPMIQRGLPFFRHRDVSVFAKRTHWRRSGNRRAVDEFVFIRGLRTRCETGWPMVKRLRCANNGSGHLLPLMTGSEVKVEVTVIDVDHMTAGVGLGYHPPLSEDNARYGKEP